MPLRGKSRVDKRKRTHHHKLPKKRMASELDDGKRRNWNEEAGLKEDFSWRFAPSSKGGVPCAYTEFFRIFVFAMQIYGSGGRI